MEFLYLKKANQKINKIIDLFSSNPYHSDETLTLDLKVLSLVKIEKSK